MLEINQTLYEQLGDLLTEAIGSQGFYSGDIYLSQPEADYYFSATLLIHYVLELYPEGYDTKISEILPVWWELHSICDDGERLNDFDFNLLKRVICS